MTVALTQAALRNARDRLKADNARLVQERDEARKFGEQAAHQYNELLAAYSRVTCAFCGEEYPRGTPRHGDGLLAEHIKICPSHPLREAEKQLAEKDARIEALERERDELLTKPQPVREGRASATLREISDTLADAGVPEGTTIHGGVLLLRERDEDHPGYRAMTFLLTNAQATDFAPFDGLCAVCRTRPGTMTWADSSLAHVHGFVEQRCEICVLEAQLAYSREIAALMPKRERRLAELLAAKATTETRS